MQLNDTHKRYLQAYAEQCHPKLGVDFKREFKELCAERLIHPKQDHITDKGLAYAMAELGMSFSDFIDRHHWNQRLAPVLAMPKSILKERSELDAYFHEKYKVLIKYGSWSQDGAELMPSFDLLPKITGEMFLALAKRDDIDWQKIFQIFQITTMGMVKLDFISSKDDLIGAIRSYLRYNDDQKTLSKESVS